VDANPGLFSKLLRELDGRPIRNCPGRYVLRRADNAVGPRAFAGPEARITEHVVPAARDKVVVTWLAGWGLISYARADGTWLHTLNTPEGFVRKLADLGIPLDEGP
jgi:hypothetical protein